MSPSEKSTEQVTLAVTANPGTEIFVVDHDFELKARGVAHIRVDLSPGLYKLKFRAGSLIQEIFQVLEPGAGTVRVTSPTMSFSSAAPLMETGKIHEYHVGAAQQTSRESHVNLGTGSQIFVFARNWTGRGGLPREIDIDHHPATGVTLHDMHGKLLLDYRAVSSWDESAEDPWAACNVNINPGSYRLRVETETDRLGAMEQVVVASPGWQTQVFLLQTDYPSKDTVSFRADLSGASILLARVGRGFDAGSADLRLTELARVALLGGRAVVPREELEQMLWAKSENPMLGVFGASALLSGPDNDLALFEKVVMNLRGLVGPHPDVEALALSLPGAVPTGDYSQPPMLRKSWSVVVDRAIEDRRLIPAGSLSSRISPQIWGDSVWLIWLARGVDSPMPAAPKPAVSEALALVAWVDDSTSKERRDPSVEASLNDFERAVLASIRNMRGTELLRPQSYLGRGAFGPISGTEPKASRDLAKALGVPPATLEATAAELVTKIRRSASTSQREPGNQGRSTDEQ
jgi:hypothetical protein